MNTYYHPTIFPTYYRLTNKEFSQLIGISAIVGGITRFGLSTLTSSPCIVGVAMAVAVTAVVSGYCMYERNANLRFNWLRMCMISLISGICIATSMCFIISQLFLQGTVTGILIPAVAGLINRGITNNDNLQRIKHLGLSSIAGGMLGGFIHLFDAPFSATAGLAAISAPLFKILHKVVDQKCQGEECSLGMEDVRYGVINSLVGFCIAPAVISFLCPTLISGIIPTTLACIVIGATTPVVSEKLDKIVIQPILTKASEGISNMWYSAPVTQ